MKFNRFHPFIVYVENGENLGREISNMNYLLASLWTVTHDLPVDKFLAHAVHTIIWKASKISVIPICITQVRNMILEVWGAEDKQ